MNFNDDELAALQGGVFSLGVFFRLATATPIRLWFGFGKILVGATVLDPEGAEYTGFGELTGLPDFNQLINGAAERVEFTLSGVSGEVLQVAAENDADAIKGKRVSVGLGIFSQGWQLLGAPHWFADYTADFLAIDQQPTGGDVVRTITLSCGTRFTGRRRPSFSYLTNQDQQARHPGDQFCIYVPRYVHGFNKAWPTFAD